MTNDGRMPNAQMPDLALGFWTFFRHWGFVISHFARHAFGFQLSLALGASPSYFRGMKRLFYLSIFSLLCAAFPLRAEDAAATAARQESEENYKILKGNIDNLTDANAALQKRIDSLEREISELRAQVSKPTGNYATTDDVKHLADAIKEVDKNRVKDNKEIVEKLAEFARIISKSSGAHLREPKETKETTHVDEPVTAPDPNQPTVTYIIKDGDYLSTIVKAYREKGFKVTVTQVVNANPGLNPNVMIPGKKILIPDTRTPDSK
jgi:LysM repeat protein